jgi:enoyl-CoA hydratase/carnithine racemase
MARNKDPWGKLVLVDFDDGIAWVTLNRPDKRNAMSPKLNVEMRATVEHLATDPRCGVLVLTGAGDSFAAGMDLKEYFRETDGKPDMVLKVRRTAEEWREAQRTRSSLAVRVRRQRRRPSTTERPRTRRWLRCWPCRRQRGRR